MRNATRQKLFFWVHSLTPVCILPPSYFNFNFNFNFTQKLSRCVSSVQVCYTQTWVVCVTREARVRPRSDLELRRRPSSSPDEIFSSFPFTLSSPLPTPPQVVSLPLRPKSFVPASLPSPPLFLFSYGTLLFSSLFPSFRVRRVVPPSPISLPKLSPPPNDAHSLTHSLSALPPPIPPSNPIAELEMCFKGYIPPIWPCTCGNVRWILAGHCITKGAGKVVNKERKKLKKKTKFTLPLMHSINIL